MSRIALWSNKIQVVPWTDLWCDAIAFMYSSATPLEIVPGIIIPHCSLFRDYRYQDKKPHTTRDKRLEYMRAWPLILTLSVQQVSSAHGMPGLQLHSYIMDWVCCCCCCCWHGGVSANELTSVRKHWHGRELLRYSRAAVSAFAQFIYKISGMLLWL